MAAGLVLELLFGKGFANYDTLYALVWGRDFVELRLPDYGADLAPTPKPLMTLIGMGLTPLGHAAEPVVVFIGYASLGILALAVFHLAAHLAGTGAGILAAAITLTREPVLSFGLRAYADIAYAALVLGALAIELRASRPRVVAGLLLAAGLLRPEAWLFSVLYVVYKWRSSAHRDRAIMVAAAGAAPALWLASDFGVTGNPLWSLTGTQDTARELARRTGLDEIPALVPRRLGEIVREPVLFGALAGAAVLLRENRTRVLPVLVVLAAALFAFGVLAAAGLPILGRYLLLPAMLLIVLASACVVTAWHRARRRASAPAIAAGAITLLLLIAFSPQQGRRLARLQSTLAAQSRITADLHALADGRRLDPGCLGPIAVPTHRPVPALALWLEVAPMALQTSPDRPPAIAIQPATQRVARLYVLDPRDPVGRPPAGGPSARTVARNASWQVTTACRGPQR